ncbi:cation:proton antiporter [Paeniroseomonas aquatica]|uniref:Cation:proton antiporter n=1 Tax=Paeniroseomonas aquatica TaxID=373043 RepID=A0ABT8ABJ9_9PROT|nr:cation:proton antiporter [Paeniroseomonas aquatica]MDN3567141.1 cation:proton antiporter [Paeniroseomonas aquatica]
MDPYIVMLVGIGGLILLVAWLPMVLRELPLSLPMFCIGIGYAVFALLGGDTPSPLHYPEAAERLTELVVIVALTGAGLKLDRRLTWRGWGLTWRLLGIAMPLSILGIGLVGHWMLGLGTAAAVLLGGALAPTDPVLASDVQVGPPQSGEEDEVRFTLTAEAGLNDGLAFPFVNLAVALALVGTEPSDWMGHFFSVDVVWKLAAGLAAGWGIGRLLGWLTFRMPNRARLSRTGDGFVALGATFLAYGLTELAHGYGFVAVFVAALAMRDAERNHAYHDRLHDFAEQTERLLMMVLLVLFGGAVAGGLLAPLGWPGAAAAAVILFVVRPAAGLLSLLGTTTRLPERGAIAFFGIRGLGSFYYLAFAANAARFPEMAELWAVVGLTVLISVGLHGMTVTPAMRWLDGRRRRQGVLALEG